MPKLVNEEEKKTRLSVSLSKRLQRRLKEISIDQEIPMAELIVRAVQAEVDRIDNVPNNAGVLEQRMNELLTSQLSVVQSINQLTDRVEELTEEVEG